MPLRLKLLLIALVASVFPLAGLRFVKQMEDTLRQGEEAALLATAHAVARATLALEPELESQAQAPGRIYAHAISFELSADGYVDDWAALVQEPQRFRAHDGSLPVDFLAALSPSALYLWFSIGDLTPVWADSFAGYPERSDHLLLSVAGIEYRLACNASGQVLAQPLPAWPNAPPLTAVCQTRARGYNIELRIPRSSEMPQLGFRVLDFPVAGADLPRSRTGTLNARGALQRWPISACGLDSPRLQGLLPAGVRMRLLSPDLVVLRRSGNLDARADLRDNEISLRRWFRAWVYRVLLAPPLDETAPYRFDLVKISAPIAREALKGIESTRWRPAGGRSTVTLAASVPLDAEHPQRGVLLLEKTSDALLIWTNRALGSLILGGVLTILIAASILFGYAGWLSYRVRKLRNAAENALTPEGRLRGNFPLSRTQDEVGDLARSFARLLEQLGEYNEYLRSLAGKLSHELSTPLAVVRSSLENLEQESISDGARVYAGRAKAGAERLGAILRAMSEANRIERAIASAEGESFDLRAVVTGATAAYRDLAGTRRIDCEVPSQAVILRGAPELIHQALDKLVDNALSFAPEHGWLRIRLTLSEGVAEVSVANQGPTLPERMRDRLFDSLISLREGKAGSPHLGLGLYIVRLIAELHGGRASAANLENGEGVEIRLVISGMKP